jgi:hypothetical protein
MNRFQQVESGSGAVRARRLMQFRRTGLAPGLDRWLDLWLVGEPMTTLKCSSGMDRRTSSVSGAPNRFLTVVPPDNIDLGVTASYAERRPDIPEAFKPELLASLESQCRDFLRYEPQQD